MTSMDQNTCFLIYIVSKMSVTTNLFGGDAFEQSSRKLEFSWSSVVHQLFSSSPIVLGNIIVMECCLGRIYFLSSDFKIVMSRLTIKHILANKIVRYIFKGVFFNLDLYSHHASSSFMGNKRNCDIKGLQKQNCLQDRY